MVIVFNLFLSNCNHSYLNKNSLKVKRKKKMMKKLKEKRRKRRRRRKVPPWKESNKKSKMLMNMFAEEVVIRVNLNPSLPSKKPNKKMKISPLPILMMTPFSVTKLFVITPNWVSKETKKNNQKKTSKLINKTGEVLP